MSLKQGYINVLAMLLSGRGGDWAGRQKGNIGWLTQRFKQATFSASQISRCVLEHSRGGNSIVHEAHNLHFSYAEQKIATARHYSREVSQLNDKSSSH